MGGFVTEYAKAVEEVGYLRRQGAIETETAEQIHLGSVVLFIKTGLRRNELCGLAPVSWRGSVLGQCN